MGRRPLIIDTDSGDSMIQAAMLVNGCGLFDLQGVCTVFGGASAKDAAVHAALIRDICGGGYPVLSGAERPLIARKNRCDAPDSCSVLSEAVSGRDYIPDTQEHPWDFIYRKAVELGGEAELFCTGPLTNLAIALFRHRDLPRYIKRITLAAGATKAGNATVYAEYNVYSDPYAFKCVLDAGFRQLDLVDLDFSAGVCLTDAEYGSLAELPAGNPWRQLLIISAKQRKDSANTASRANAGRNGMICHDAAAAFVLALPEAISTSNVYTMVELRSDICSGRTLFDFERRFTDGPNVRLSVYTPREMFADFFFRCLHSFDGRTEE